MDSESFCANWGLGLDPADNLIEGSYPTQILFINYPGYPLSCSFTPVEIDITGCSPELTDVVYKIDQSSYRLMTGENIVEINPETNQMIFKVKNPKSVTAGTYLIEVIGTLPTGQSSKFEFNLALIDGWNQPFCKSCDSNQAVPVLDAKNSVYSAYSGELNKLMFSVGDNLANNCWRQWSYSLAYEVPETRYAWKCCN